MIPDFEINRFLNKYISQIFIFNLYNFILFGIMLKHIQFIQYSNNLCSRYLNVFQIILYYRCIISSNNRLILFSRLCFLSNEPEKKVLCAAENTFTHIRKIHEVILYICVSVCTFAQNTIWWWYLWVDDKVVFSSSFVHLQNFIINNENKSFFNNL